MSYQPFLGYLMPKLGFIYFLLVYTLNNYCRKYFKKIIKLYSFNHLDNLFQSMLFTSADAWGSKFLVLSHLEFLLVVFYWKYFYWTAASCPKDESDMSILQAYFFYLFIYFLY